MAVTQEFIEQVAEALKVLGDALEASDSSPRGVEIISDEEQISDTLSLPAVLYDSDPMEHDDARAVKYVQIPWSILSTLINTLRTEVASAEEVLTGADEAYSNETDLVYLDERKHYAWIKYIKQ